ncbi:hypothetical protein RHMOL_Rhmol04G0091900 [Rhododendron molle]|uniref:Uncharacterized protein n=1 Tax=Rhododendron molle TaxID=49168 RepID=A0ACC0P098_RHOML|nr:hypothetical protein RHMOL_Rhmol04G0091900 [Rhododendron molle]
MAWGRNITKALFESDCQVVIDCIRNEDQQCLWEIEALVVDIRQWAAHRNWSFFWVCRQQNSAAHWMPSNCIDRILNVNIFNVNHVVFHLVLQI